MEIIVTQHMKHGNCTTQRSSFAELRWEIYMQIVLFTIAMEDAHRDGTVHKLHWQIRIETVLFTQRTAKYR